MRESGEQGEEGTRETEEHGNKKQGNKTTRGKWRNGDRETGE